MDQFNNNGGMNLNKDNGQNSFQQGAFNQGAFEQNMQQNAQPQQGAFDQNAFQQNMQNQNAQPQQGAFDQNAFQQNMQTPNNNFGGSYNGGYGGMQPQKSTKAGISLGLGIASLVIGCCCTWLGLALGVAGIILGVLSKKDNEPKSGMATAGIIVSGISIGGTILWMIISAATGITEELLSSFTES